MNKFVESIPKRIELNDLISELSFINPVWYIQLSQEKVNIMVKGKMGLLE